MKKLLVVLLTMVFLAMFSSTVFAECEDPTGKTFSTTNCEQMKMTLAFSDAVFGPYPTCQRGILEVSTKATQSLADQYIDKSDGMVKIYYPFAWNAATCTAKLYATDCETEAPILWLYFDGDTILFLNMPTFLVVE